MKDNNSIIPSRRSFLIALPLWFLAVITSCPVLAKEYNRFVSGSLEPSNIVIWVSLIILILMVAYWLIAFLASLIID